MPVQVLEPPILDIVIVGGARPGLFQPTAGKTPPVTVERTALVVIVRAAAKKKDRLAARPDVSAR